MSVKKMVVLDKNQERAPDFCQCRNRIEKSGPKARLRALQAGVGVIVIQGGWITPFDLDT